MKYTDIKLRQMLAGEYALGTLRGRARARFARLLQADPALREELRFWERHFAALAQRVRPVPPRPLVWAAVQHRIARAPTVTALPTARAPAANDGFWRGWAVFASAATLVLAFALYQQSTTPPPVPRTVTVEVPVDRPVTVASYVAALAMPDEAAQWTVSLTPAQRQLRIAVSGEPKLAPSKDYELWYLADAGPVSLGLLPRSGAVQREIPQAVRVSGGGKVAVSLEAAGGSRSGAPGTVLMAAPVLQAG